MESTDLIIELLNNSINDYCFEHKSALKKKRPMPHLSLTTPDGKTVRKFQFTWYSTYSWLAGSQVNNKLYCYYCLLFKGEKTWGEEGVSVVKNFERKANKHAISPKHLICHEKFKFLGINRIDYALSEGRRLAAFKHNEQVEINRRLLSRLIYAVCNLGKQEPYFHVQEKSKSSVNNSNYVELLELLSYEEKLLKKDFLSSPLFKDMSSNVQNELVACISEVVNIKIMKELNSAKFVSIQVDETTVSCKLLMSIILRYVVDSSIEERFIGLFDVSKSKNVSELSSILLDEIKKWNISDKIVCQTYDGAAVMAGQQNGVQAIIKKTYPKIMFIHCYAHQLNLVFLHGLNTIKPVRDFISDLTTFHTFFSESPERSQRLLEKGFKLPNSGEIRWNYQSKAAATISSHFKELQKAVSGVTIEEGWDPTSICMACFLMQKLSDSKFVYLLCLFNQVFKYSDHVFLILQSNCTTDVQSCINEINNLCTHLTAMRNDENTISNYCKAAKELNNELEYLENNVNNMKILSHEILDSIIVHIQVRFQDLNLLTFVELSNKNAFKNYKNNFPIDKLNELEKLLPGVFDLKRLQNELTILYNDKDKYLPPKELLSYIIKGIDIIYKCYIYIYLQ